MTKFDASLLTDKNEQKIRDLGKKIEEIESEYYRNSQKYLLGSAFISFKYQIQARTFLEKYKIPSKFLYRNFGIIPSLYYN